MRARLLACSIVAACVPITTTSTVAHVEPTTRTGAPLASRVELVGETSVITSATTGGDSSALLVSRWHAGAEVRIRATPEADVDLIGGVSSSTGPVTHTSGFPKAPDFNPWEVGIGLQVTARAAKHVVLAFAPRALAMTGAWHTKVETGNDTALILSLPAIVRWEVAPHFALFGSLTLVNQPTTGSTNDPCFFNFECEKPPSTSGMITFGNEYMIPAVGAEVRADGASFALLVYWPGALTDPSSVDYGPAFLATASVALW